MTSVTHRIGLQSAIEIFDGLKTSSKVKLPHELTDKVDSIIHNNMSRGMEEYADELSDIRFVL